MGFSQENVPHEVLPSAEIYYGLRAACWVSTHPKRTRETTFAILSLAIGIALCFSRPSSIHTNEPQQAKGRCDSRLFIGQWNRLPLHADRFQLDLYGKSTRLHGSLTACYDGFVLTNTTTNQIIADPSAIGPVAQSYNWVPAEGVPYGNLIALLAAHGYDENGNVVLASGYSSGRCQGHFAERTDGADGQATMMKGTIAALAALITVTCVGCGTSSMQPQSLTAWAASPPCRRLRWRSRGMTVIHSYLCAWPLNRLTARTATR